MIFAIFYVSRNQLVESFFNEETLYEMDHARFPRKKKNSDWSPPAIPPKFLVPRFPPPRCVALIDIFHGNATSRRSSWVQRRPG